MLASSCVHRFPRGSHCRTGGRRAADDDGVPVTLTFYALLWAHPGADDALAAYEDKVLGLLGDHGAKLLQRARSDGAEGRPSEIQLFEFPSSEAFDAYMANPRRTALTSEREAAIARTQLINVQLL
jgi:uncharacterized protein (DUF1330 family)